MKFLLGLFIVMSPLVFASGLDQSPRQPDPTPFTEPREEPNDPLEERKPYSDPDDSVDYQRDENSQPYFLCEQLLKVQAYDWR